jgi:hypothetical protein
VQIGVESTVSDDIIPLRGKDVVEVGGLVDSSSASLCLYGEMLEPDGVSQLLGVQPTTAIRRGDKRGPRSPESPRGVWILRVEGDAPAGPEQHLRQLLMRLPTDRATWEAVRSHYEVRISVGIHINAWNRGFVLGPELLRSVAALGLELDFDIYANAEDEA